VWWEGVMDWFCVELHVGKPVLFCSCVCVPERERVQEREREREFKRERERTQYALHPPTHKHKELQE
jgi:hypothetical protein